MTASVRGLLLHQLYDGKILGMGRWKGESSPHWHSQLWQKIAETVLRTGISYWLSSDPVCTVLAVNTDNPRLDGLKIP